MGRKRLIWAALLAPVVVVALSVAAWAVDNAGGSSRVARNVELAGVPVGGMGVDVLRQHLEALASAQLRRPVRLETPEITYETTAAELGLRIDRAATEEAVLDTGRSRALPLRPIGWLLSFVSPRHAGLRYEVDVEMARATLRRLEGDALLSPVEPTVVSADGGPFEAIAGRAGTGIDPETLAVALVSEARAHDPDEPLQLRIQQTLLEPRLDDRVAQIAAVSANEWSDGAVQVRAGSSSTVLTTEDIRRLAHTVETADGLEVRMDPEAVLAHLRTEFAAEDVAPRDAHFEVGAAGVRLVAAEPGTKCCALGAAALIDEALDDGLAIVEVPLTELDPEFTTEEAEALGIVEEIGDPEAFGPTTRHACCQNRVTNIHRIADIVRGAVIAPGETFSINEYVGRRTVEKGFVTDGVIYDGVLTEDVGGGVSQFATGLFNAALYAGLEFGTYQSHSLYISRYPRGHDATISFPQPDLEIVNPTPYGVLIWPEYTSTSLTVRLFSTRHIDVEVRSPTPSEHGRCTRWTTTRLRTWEDGRSETDSVAAVYRPEEGVNCFGPPPAPDPEPDDGGEPDDGEPGGSDTSSTTTTTTTSSSSSTTTTSPDPDPGDGE